MKRSAAPGCQISWVRGARGHTISGRETNVFSCLCGAICGHVATFARRRPPRGRSDRAPRHVRAPDLVGPGRPGPYHLRARNESFRAFVAPFADQRVCHQACACRDLADRNGEAQMVCDQLSPSDFLPTHETSHSRRHITNSVAGLNGFVGTRQPGFPLIGAAREQM
jgi:hypothetical protein